MFASPRGCSGNPWPPPGSTRIIRPPVSRSTFGFSISVTRLRPVLLGVLERLLADVRRTPARSRCASRARCSPAPSPSTASSSDSRTAPCKPTRGSGMKLDAAVRCLRCSRGTRPDRSGVFAARIRDPRPAIVQRVAGIALHGRMLVCRLNIWRSFTIGREVDQPLVLELGNQLFLGFVVAACS